MPTPLQYYSDPNNYGNYQYVTLDEILDSILTKAELDDDHLLKGMKRALLLMYGKDAVREITRVTPVEAISFAITVPDSNAWPIPQDYVSCRHISLVITDPLTSSYRLVPLNVNNTINTSVDYLQEETGDLMFDEGGNILEADVMNAFGSPYRIYSYRMQDASLLSAHGEVVVDKKRGYFCFSSDVAGKTVVIGYRSDGLEAQLSGGIIKIHKDLRNAVSAYIKWVAIDDKKNIGAGEKQRAKNRYESARHSAVMSMSGISLTEISRTLRANPNP